jgi:AMMECR1 domain-containing protein
MTEKELSEIKIEVSVLSPLKKINYTSERDLLMRINPGRGILLKRGVASATFLPQVWEELPDKIQFLEHLSLKAGLNKEGWKDSEFWYYTVTIYKE